LSDGVRTLNASVETADGTDQTGRDHRLNVAAYQLDTLLGLGMVPPSVAREISGRPAAVTWWVADVAMHELDRRRRSIVPPDPERWDRQVLAVRLFDELIANAYRDTHPSFELSTVWDNLLITRGGTVWIVDHTRAFRVSDRLEAPGSLRRCDRRLLARLRGLTPADLERALAPYLSSWQLRALATRRALLVAHFDELIERHGEAAVLYDMPPR
jgi:hypothetical protein